MANRVVTSYQGIVQTNTDAEIGTSQPDPNEVVSCYSFSWIKGWIKGETSARAPPPPKLRN